MQDSIATRETDFLGTSTWAKYLGLLALIIGAGFLSSGVVTWLAANWAGFSKFQKLYGTQAIFVLMLLLSMGFYWYQKHKLKSPNFALPSAVMTFIGAVLIGALFALIGQTYQTGADLWQLFAVWTALQVPLLLALPNVAAFILFAVTTHVSFALFIQQENYFSYSDYIVDLIYIAISLVFLLISEVFSQRLHDSQWRVLPKLAALGVGVAILMGALSSYDWVKQYALIGILLGGIGMFVYRRWRFDLSIFVLSMLLVVFCVLYLILSSAGIDEAALYLTAFLLVIAGIIGVIYGLNVWRQRVILGHAKIDDIPWVLQAFFLIVVMIAAIIVVALLFFSAGLERLYVPALLFIVLGLAIKFRQKLAGHPSSVEASSESAVVSHETNGLILNLLSQAFIALGVAMLFVDTFFLSIERYGLYSFSNNSLSGVSMNALLFALLCIVLFFLVKATWLRVLMTVLFSWTLFTLILPPLYLNAVLGINSDELGYGNYAEPEFMRRLLFIHNIWFLLVPICLFLGYRYQAFGRRSRALFWALSLYTLASFVFGSAQMSLFGGIGAQALESRFDTLGEVKSLWFYLGGQLFENLSLYGLPSYLIVLAPVVLTYLLGRSLPLMPRVMSCLVVLALSIMWSGNAAVLFALSLLLVAYQMRSYKVFALALLAGTGFLALHYFSMHIPLLHKSYILLISGLLLLSLLALWYVWFERRQVMMAEGSMESLPVHSKREYLPLGLIGLCLVVVLGLANYKTTQYEGVLKHGESVILELEPVDPRSLMQGDYMELGFSLTDDIYHLLSGRLEESNDGFERTGVSLKGYALLRKDERGVARLCRLSNTIPGDFADCEPGLLIPYTLNDRWPYVSLPSHQYFFAEGAGSYFALARFGEFRVTSEGVALLVGLLDKDLQPMQAPEDMQEWIKQNQAELDRAWNTTGTEVQIETPAPPAMPDPEVQIEAPPSPPPSREVVPEIEAAPPVIEAPPSSGAVAPQLEAPPSSIDTADQAVNAAAAAVIAAEAAQEVDAVTQAAQEAQAAAIEAANAAAPEPNATP